MSPTKPFVGDLRATLEKYPSTLHLDYETIGVMCVFWPQTPLLLLLLLLLMLVKLPTKQQSGSSKCSVCSPSTSLPTTVVIADT
jgi:hypothetical protein